MSYIDSPNKKLLHPPYEHRSAKLDEKDNAFTSKKFQRVRNVSTRRKILKSFRRIGMFLNNTPISIMPIEDLNKVCFILINDYNSDENKYRVGPLNDGYLIALKHYRLGFKVFYLYNSKINQFPFFLQFFMNNTADTLTVFYTGNESNSESIKFKDGNLSKNYIQKIISSNCNGKLRVVFITDNLGGGSFFDITRCSNAISFSVKKTEPNQSKENKRSHGIFTYYFCKMIGDKPIITPNAFVEQTKQSLIRFNEIVICELTDDELGNRPILFG